MTEIDFGLAGYVLGIVSIVFGFVTPVAGLVTGIIGLNISKKEKTELSKRGKKLNVIGISISVVILLALAILFIYSYKTGQLTNIPSLS